MSSRAIALAVIALLGCRSENAGKAPADRPASQAAATQPESSAAASASAPAGQPMIAFEARSACAGVAGFWRRYDTTEVRQVDSVVSPYASDTTVSACIVSVYQEHSPLQNPKAPVDTTVQHLETALALVRGAGPGWIPLYRYSADGPDGSDLAYQRGRVRCLVERSWDGGDDSDSTYVPADWFREHTTCWMVARPLAAADTAP